MDEKIRSRIKKEGEILPGGFVEHIVLLICRKSLERVSFG